MADTKNRPLLWTTPSLDITLTGVAGQTYVIQATTNLQTWDFVLTNVNSGAVFDLIISDSTDFPHRFYRTFEP